MPCLKSFELRLFECLYSSDQSVSHPLLQPLAISNHFPDRRELQAYAEIHRRGLHRSHTRTGLLSPKFNLKTHHSIPDFITFNHTHPEADVCLINPFPQIRYWSYNVWMQGEHAHPGLLKQSQILLNAVGFDIDLGSTPRHGTELLAYSNFWTATPAFWDAYVGEVLLPISDFLDQHPRHPAVVGILQDTNHTDAAPFLPFMIERLFSTWLSLHPEWTVAAYPMDLDEILSRYCLNDYERLLVQQMREQVDAADVSGVFPEALRQRMDDMCTLFQQHFFDFYAHRPHPHSGQVVTRRAT